MSGTADKFMATIAAVAIITAFGLHATQLSGLAKSTGTAGSGLLHTAETG